MAVSDHVFHRSKFLQLSFPCFCVSHPFSWLTIARWMQYTLPCLVRRRHYLQMLVFLTFLLLTLREQSAAPSRWMKNQRNLLTTVAFLAKRVQILKLRPDAFPDSGRL